MKSKFISVLTALAIIFSLMPSAFAADGTEPLFNNWTEAAEAAVPGTDYIQNNTSCTIKTAKGLAWFANKVNTQSTSLSAMLENDIDLSKTVKQGESWIPIAYETKQFSGTFDGQGHTIKGLVIENGEEEKNYGLFGTIHLSGVVQNVKIEGKISLLGKEYNGEDYSPIDHSYGGAIAGENRGTIINCDNAADIIGTYTGGIAGVNRGVIGNCRNSGNIIGYEEIGGITGLNIDNYYNNNKPASISYCYNTGNITGCEDIGGIAGRTSSSSIDNSSNSGKITGQIWAGGITGFGDGAAIENCENSGTIEVSFDENTNSGCQDIGGIVGHISNLYGDSWKVQYCHNTGTIIANYGYDIGGIAGLTSGIGSVLDCVNDGKIDTTRSDAGGVLGRSCGGSGDKIPLVANCVNNGEVSGTEEVGGIAGETTATIVNSYSTGKITATNQNAGGVVGKTSNYSPNYSTGKVTNCYNIGEVSSDKNAGSVVGYRYYGTVENCYYPNGQQASGSGSVNDCLDFDANGILADGTLLVEKLNGNVRTLSNNSWSFWTASQNPPAVFTADVFMSWTDAGNAAEAGTDYTINGDTYTIYTPLGLAFIANTVNGGDTLQGKTVVLNNDIDLSGVVNDTDLNDENSWNPIGTDKGFSGTFDGQNHTVSGMKINRNTYYQGLFKHINDNGEVKNLGITNSNITILRNADSNSLQNAGMIVGYNEGAIRNCYTGENTAISSYTSAGGIVGQNRGIIENSNNAASITANQSRAGGICATNVIGTITNCSNTGEIASNITYAGGICGTTIHPDSLIMNCYNAGNISSGKYYTGGIIGNAASGKVLNCYNIGDITITSSIVNRYPGGICGNCNKAEILNCYNAGNVSAKGGTGGIAGYLSDVTAKIENCYYLSSTAAKPIADNATTYIPVNCNAFGEDGIIVNTNKSLCDALNDGVHLLNNTDAFTWINGQGIVEFGEPLSAGLTVEAIKLTKAPASSYIQGQTFNPSGMIITLLYSNGSQADVVYSEENVNDFTFTPALNTELTTSDTEIAVEYNGQSVSVPITVSEKNVTGINVSSLPNKTTYLEGQELDLAGMTVTAAYDNGDSEPIDSYDVTGYDKDKVGNQNVTVSFGGFTASFTVTVKAKTVTGITILSEPAKKEFVEGSTIDVSGLIVQAQYDNDTTAIVTDYTVNGYDKNTIGNQTVTISYSGFDASFDVEVVAKSLTGITLNTDNAKTSYIEGNPLDTSGLVVTAQYDNGSEQVIAKGDYTISGYSKKKVGIQTVTIEYEGFTAQYDVEVVEKTLIGLKILLAPPKRDYIEGEELDTAGLVLWAKYDNGTGKNVIGKVTGYDKNKIGTQLISVEYGGFTAEYTVNVAAKSLTDVTIAHKPFTTEYIEGQDLDLNGLTVTAKYNNGTSAEVYDYTISGYDKTTVGTQTVTVTHGGMTASFDVVVKPKSIAGIKITKLPDRTNYVEGQDLNLDGMELTVYYNNGTSELTDNYTVSGYDKDVVGEQLVTVEYEGNIAKMLVTVTDKSITQIEIASEPTKTNYIEGQDLELAGLTVTATYNDGTSGNVTGYDIIGYDKNKTGEQVVTVEYAGQTAQFTVNVEAKTLENIMIIKLPFKTEYIEEQELDLTGICVIANYNNGISEEITDYSVSMFDNTAYGMQTIVLTYQDKTATFSLTVAQKQMTKLAITTMPEHITYQKGQELDLTGMTVTAAYDNGKSEAVDDYNITGFDKNVAGRQTVVVEYGLMSDSFNVMVAEKTLTGITVTQPAKTTYNVGEELDLTGMTVSKVFDNDETEVITEGYTVTGYDKNKIGQQTITVECEGFKAEFNVTVRRKGVGGGGEGWLNSNVSFNTASSIAEITAAPEDCEAGVIVAALYKGNVLMAVKTVDYNGTDAPNAISIPYTVQPDTVKVMLWDSLQNMKPLCESETPTENAE